MIKKWNEFLIKESTKYEDFEKYPSRLELNFGLSNLELFDCLYDFKPDDFNIKVGYTFMDDVTNRDAIKIDEYLYPTISIQISNRFMKKLDKIASFCPFKWDIVSFDRCPRIRIDII